MQIWCIWYLVRFGNGLWAHIDTSGGFWSSLVNFIQVWLTLVDYVGVFFIKCHVFYRVSGGDFRIVSFVCFWQLTVRWYVVIDKGILEKNMEFGP